ncbi:hypothetical protein B0H13DRAFT_2327934 [Mycena leptocephala]|nr:hypothetical protein B0H13DRAFT_2327934 [Mycena leptocephala]
MFSVLSLFLGGELCGRPAPAHEGPTALEDGHAAAHGEGGCVWAEAPEKRVCSKMVEGGSPLGGGNLPWMAPTKPTLDDDGFPRLRRVDTACDLLVLCYFTPSSPHSPRPPPPSPLFFPYS